MASVNSREYQAALLERGSDAQPATDVNSWLAGAAMRPQAFKSKHLDLPVARKLHGAGAAEYALQEMEK
jgi:hypothetical protein